MTPNEIRAELVRRGITVTRGTRIAAVVGGKVIFATVSFVIGFGPDALAMLFGHDEVVLLTSCLILG